MIKELKINKNNLLYISTLFVLSRIFVIVIALCSETPINEIFNLFDAEHYQYIAANGYTHEPYTAFFPVIPLIIRYLGVGGAIFINQLAAIGTMFLIDDLLGDIKTEVKILALSIFAFSPITTYSIIPYTESLFMFFTLLAFYMFVKRKIDFLLGVVIGLCVATRNSGSMLFFAIFFAMCYLWHEKELKFKEIVITYIPATIISCIYPAYLQYMCGNWKMFMDCQKGFWSRVDSNIFFLFKNQISILFNPNHYDGVERTPLDILMYRTNEIITIVLGLLILTLGILVLKNYKKKNIAYDFANNLVCFTYIALSIFCFTLSVRNPLGDSPSTSFFRYFLGFFPIYIGVGVLNKKWLVRVFCVMIMFTFIVSLFFYSNSFFY